MRVYVGSLGGWGGMCVFVRVKWADKGHEGQYVAFSFRGQRTVKCPSRLAPLFARSMRDEIQDECRQC